MQQVSRQFWHATIRNECANLGPRSDWLIRQPYCHVSKCGVLLLLLQSGCAMSLYTMMVHYPEGQDTLSLTYSVNCLLGTLPGIDFTGSGYVDTYFFLKGDWYLSADVVQQFISRSHPHDYYACLGSGILFTYFVIC